MKIKREIYVVRAPAPLRTRKLRSPCFPIRETLDYSAARPCSAKKHGDAASMRSPVPCGYKRAHNGSRCAADFAGPLKKHSFVLLRKYEGCFLRRKYKKERPQKLGQRQDRAGKKDAARPIKREILFHVHDKNNIIFLRSVGTA